MSGSEVWVDREDDGFITDGLETEVESQDRDASASLNLWGWKQAVVSRDTPCRNTNLFTNLFT